MFAIPNKKNYNQTMEHDMVILNSIKLLSELSSIEEKIKSVQSKLREQKIDFDEEEVVVSVLNNRFY